MELLVAADSLIYKTPDGKYWCKTIYSYDFWLRYLTVFDHVAVASRTLQTNYSEVEGFLRVDGPNVRIIELPYMRGMKQYIKNYFSFCKAAKQAVKEADCALIRLPSVSAAMVWKYYKRKNKPYALEVVVDPFDAYASNKLAKILYTRNLKKAALHANGVSYVTKYYLQNKYPSFSRVFEETDRHFESYYSTINLSESYFATPRTYSNVKKQFTIVHTANSINNDIKGHGTLIQILKKLREKQYDVRVVFIGDGNRRSYFEQMSKELGVKEQVTFTGLLSSPQKVREALIKGDIFVFPTKAEGLPRAIIEAMAVGLPCLSTPVNGIPELLKKDNLFNPNDINGFTEKIIELINNPEQLNRMSIENIKKATEYIDYKLNERRKEFYLKLRNLCE